MTIFAVLVALEVAAVVLAVRAAGCSFRGWLRNPRLVAKKAADSVRSPLVLVLAYALADEVLVEAIHHALAGAPKPWRGVHRAAYHLETCLVLGWPALLAGTAWSLYAGQVPGLPSSSPAQRHGGAWPGGRKHEPPHGSSAPHVASEIGTAPPVLGSRGVSSSSWPKSSFMVESLCSRRACELLFGAWLVVAGGLAACFPLPKGMTAPLLHTVELLFVAVALASIPAGWRSRAIVTREGRALGIVLVTELCVAVLGAWGAGAGVFTSWNELARVPYAIGWGVLCVVLAARPQ